MRPSPDLYPILSKMQTYISNYIDTQIINLQIFTFYQILNFIISIQIFSIPESLYNSNIELKLVEIIYKLLINKYISLIPQ